MNRSFTSQKSTNFNNISRSSRPPRPSLSNSSLSNSSDSPSSSLSNTDTPLFDTPSSPIPPSRPSRPSLSPRSKSQPKSQSQSRSQSQSQSQSESQSQSQSEKSQPKRKLLKTTSSKPKQSPQTKKSKENSPVSNKSKQRSSLTNSKERSPVAKKSKERSPVTKKPKEKSPVKKLKERSPVTKKSKERSPVTKKPKERSPVKKLKEKSPVKKLKEKSSTPVVKERTPVVKERKQVVKKTKKVKAQDENKEESKEEEKKEEEKKEENEGENQNKMVFDTNKPVEDYELEDLITLAREAKIKARAKMGKQELYDNLYLIYEKPESAGKQTGKKKQRGTNQANEEGNTNTYTGSRSRSKSDKIITFDPDRTVEDYSLKQLRDLVSNLRLENRSELKTKQQYFDALKANIENTGTHTNAPSDLEEFDPKYKIDDYTKIQLYNLAKSAGLPARKDMNKFDLYTMLTKSDTSGYRSVANNIRKSLLNSDGSIKNIILPDARKLAKSANIEDRSKLNKKQLIDSLIEFLERAGISVSKQSEESGAPNYRTINLKELKEIAQQKGIQNVSRTNKADLIAMIERFDRRQAGLPSPSVSRSRSPSPSTKKPIKEPSNNVAKPKLHNLQKQ